MTKAPSGIKACFFDAYGTLFDVNAAARALAAELGDKWQPMAEMWRNKQLSYSWLRSLMGRHADFWQLTGDALDFTMEAHGVRDAGLRQRLMDLYFNLACFPEVPAMLQSLKRAGLVTGILSNGSPAMLEAACKTAGLDGLLDHVLSVEDIGIFKPDMRIYQLVTDRLDLPASAVAFHSSNGWDIHGGKTFGFYSVWINRSGQPQERLPNPPDVILKDLAEVPRVVGATA